jgi:hypothetical protein
VSLLLTLLPFERPADGGRRFVPQYFEKDMSKGYAALTAAGAAAIEEELNEPISFHIDDVDDGAEPSP